MPTVLVGVCSGELNLGPQSCTGNIFTTVQHPSPSSSDIPSCPLTASVREVHSGTVDTGEMDERGAGFWDLGLALLIGYGFDDPRTLATSIFKLDMRMWLSGRVIA